MPRYRRLEVINLIQQIGIVPVFYTGDLESASAIARSCADGGARVLEFTNRGDGAWEVFAGLERYCAAECTEAVLGAGSVVDAATAALYVNTGASFVVGPATNPAVAELCNRRKVAYVPGCATPTEISSAEALGCELVKVFPGDAVGGPEFVKAVVAPMPWTSIIPTGGVDITRESLSGWFSAGVFAVGIGSRLISADLVKARDWVGLSKRVRATVDLAQEVRRKA